MRYLAAFGRFWYGFVVGDDWRVAAIVLAGLALTGIVAHAGHDAWWILPALVGGALWVSVLREARRSLLGR